MPWCLLALHLLSEGRRAVVCCAMHAAGQHYFSSLIFSPVQIPQMESHLQKSMEDQAFIVSAGRGSCILWQGQGANMDIHWAQSSQGAASTRVLHPINSVEWAYVAAQVQERHKQLVDVVQVRNSPVSNRRTSALLPWPCIAPSTAQLPHRGDMVHLFELQEALTRMAGGCAVRVHPTSNLAALLRAWCCCGTLFLVVADAGRAGAAERAPGSVEYDSFLYCAHTCSRWVTPETAGCTVSCLAAMTCMHQCFLCAASEMHSWLANDDLHWRLLRRYLLQRQQQQAEGGQPAKEGSQLGMQALPRFGCCTRPGSTPLSLPCHCQPGEKALFVTPVFPQSWMWAAPGATTRSLLQSMDSGCCVLRWGHRLRPCCWRAWQPTPTSATWSGPSSVRLAGRPGPCTCPSKGTMTGAGQGCCSPSPTTTLPMRMSQVSEDSTVGQGQGTQYAVRCRLTSC